MRGAGPFSCIYFITWIFLGNFVLLNLFLAILLDSFSDEEGDNDEMQELMYDKQDYSTEDFTKLAV